MGTKPPRPITYAEAVPKPTKDLGICIFCGAAAKWKPDRNGRPYFACDYCHTRMFPTGHWGIIGVEALQELIVYFGRERYRKVIEGKLAERLRRRA